MVTSMPAAAGMLQFKLGGKPVEGWHGITAKIVRPRFEGTVNAFISASDSLQTERVKAQTAGSVKFVPGTSTKHCPPKAPHHDSTVFLAQMLIPKSLRQLSTVATVFVYNGT